AGVDRRAHVGIGLERQPLAHRLRLGQDSVEFRSRRRAGPQLDAEVVSPRMSGTSPRRHRSRHRFRVSRTGETAPGHPMAMVDVTGRLIGGNGLVSQLRARDSRHDPKSIGRCVSTTEAAPPRDTASPEFTGVPYRSTTGTGPLPMSVDASDSARDCRTTVWARLGTGMEPIVASSTARVKIIAARS